MEHKVLAGTVYLYIDPTGGTNYDTVVCGTSVGKDDSVGEIDASSQCGHDVSPGELALSRSFEGQHLQDPDTAKISGTSLRVLMYNKTLVGYKIASDVAGAGPEPGDELETGVGYITALSSTYAFNDVGKFTMTLKPSGTPTITEES